jgi:SAM-dependent methyltransferase
VDAASGEGYGSSLLAGKAASVVGIDVSPEATRHASDRYAAGNLRFVTASVAQIPLPDASFDVIVSFETIEHMTEHEAFMREIDRLLAPGGMLIISSPNRPEYSDKTGYHNEFHVKELDRAELKTLLDRHFPAQKWFAQRPAFHSMIWPLSATATAAEALTADGNDGWPDELYFLVFAAREGASLAQVVPTVTLVTDREQSVYAEWSRTYRETGCCMTAFANLKPQPSQCRRTRSSLRQMHPPQPSRGWCALPAASPEDAKQCCRKQIALHWPSLLEPAHHGCCLSLTHGEAASSSMSLR